MQKILITGAGSGADPGYADIKVGEIQFKDHMENRGIVVIEQIIESCHGCPDLMTKYSSQLQSRVEAGDRVVGVLQGGLLFGLPSIQATQVTYPIISNPLDMVAYTAFMVPSGHAVIAGTSIERKEEGVYQTTQREKSLKVATNILDLESKGVSLVGNGDLEKVLKELDNLGIEVVEKSDLVLNYSSDPSGNVVDKNQIQIWADTQEDLMQGGYFSDAEMILRGSEYTIQVKGLKNLAIYAAKILSLGNEELRNKLIAMKDKKRLSYEERDLKGELGGN